MLSVVVLTKNEEQMIKACLESVKWADEIVVVDQGSTDRTLEIVGKYTDKIFKNTSLDFTERRNMGMEKSSGDWVLYIDSDERVLEPLRQEIQSLIGNTEKSAFALKRKNVIFGTEVNYEPYKNDWMIKLLKKSDFKTWKGEVHEYATFNGELGYTKNHLLHLTHRDLDQIVQKSLNWSKIDAKLRFDANHPKMSSWRFFRILISETLNQGILRKGFFNGEVGVMDAMLQVFSLFMTYVRLWQMQQRVPLEEKYRKIDEELMKNGFKYS